MDAFKERASLVAILLLVSLAYSNSFQGEFVYDSAHIIANNDLVTGVAPVFDIFRRDYWHPAAESGYYRPLAILTFRIQADLAGGRLIPEWFHAVNFAIHLINVLLFHQIVAGLARPAAATCAALIFGVHPVNVDAVTNLVGRADLLAALGVLVAVLLYRQKRFSAAKTISAPWLVGLCLIYFLSMLCKEHAALLPAYLAVMDVTILRSVAAAGPAFRPPVRVYGALALTAAAAWGWRAMVFQDMGFAGQFTWVDPPLEAYSALEKGLTTLNITGRYLGLMAWPAGLSVEHTFAQISKMTLPGMAIDWLWALLGVLLITAALMDMLGCGRLSGCFAGWLILAILPALAGVYLFGARLEERWMYLPSAALSAWISLRLLPAQAPIRRVRAAALALAAACLLLGARTWMRNLDWRNAVSLVTSARAESPRSGKAQFGVSAVWADIYRTDPDHYRRLGSALELYEQSRYRRYRDEFESIAGDPARLHMSLLDLVIDESWAAVTLAPGIVAPRGVLGWALIERSRANDDPQVLADVEQAETVLSQAVELDEEYRWLRRENLIARGLWSDRVYAGAYRDVYLRLTDAYDRMGQSPVADAVVDRLRAADPVLSMAHEEAASRALRRGDLFRARVLLCQAALTAPPGQATRIEAAIDELPKPDEELARLVVLDAIRDLSSLYSAAGLSSVPGR